MSEIVYTETDKHRDHIKDMTGGRTIADAKRTVWVSPTKVSITESRLVVGVPRGHKDKRYYYWMSTESLGIFRNRAGNPQAYHAYRPWDATRKSNWTMGGAQAVFELLGSKDSEKAEVFTHEVWKTFGFNSLEGMYPIAGMYNLPNYTYIPYAIKPAMRESNWADFTMRVFGKTRTTPKLISAVQKSEPYLVSYAHQFRGLVPNPLIETFLSNQGFDEEMEEGFQLHNPNIRKYLMLMNEDSRVNILNKGLDLHDTNIISYLSGGSAKFRLNNLKIDGTYGTWNDVWGNSPTS